MLGALILPLRGRWPCEAWPEGVALRRTLATPPVSARKKRAEPPSLRGGIGLHQRRADTHMRLPSPGRATRWTTGAGTAKIAAMASTLRATVLMKTDISGSTARSRALPEAELHKLLAEHRALITRHA